MFTKAFFSAAVACGLLASSVNAHMMIKSPVPYGKDSLNNSPLAADGSDFPCKQRSGVYDVTQMNNMPVGVPQELSFIGGATHGGGSCQVSVTMDKEPTKQSKWKVVQSILGGCPSNVTGNLSGNPDGTDASVFQFSIPKGMPNGEYSLAWTWFNKIGNREMYMNCAPIKVTGGSDSQDVYNSLPDMFVANIGNGCTVGESQDFVFPQCGKYVETAEKTALGSSTSGTCATEAAGGGSGSEASPTASSGSDSGAGSSSGYGSSSAAAAPTGYGAGSGSGAAQTSAAQSAPAYAAPSEAASAPGESAQSTKAQIATITTMATVTASGYAPAGAAAPTGAAAASAPSYGTSGSSGVESSGSDASNGTSSSGSCEGGAVSCDSDGSVVCIGSSQWGMCNAGCAVPMALATGTTCSGGVIAKREMINHLRRHIAHAHKF
ncbi:lytic polysaccharide monooxygenase [Zasmidium cellare ATCC 36951]|uniref:Lytic polysaccharide monooxygenase n=1 Tax=Zasmidium cellare ATCC 36951 TaxID=1080233 RepID=A0A6A6CZW1_ZASCE|nr:lytic polysaccharide monooxygenase [Zasmidium cellare ATCC 36951]KAF2170916.1 lytic polysaccharide monooxygenase [Zasmidium cellare ATCC 36951]